MLICNENGTPRGVVQTTMRSTVDDLPYQARFTRGMDMPIWETHRIVLINGRDPDAGKPLLRWLIAPRGRTCAPFWFLRT